MSESVCEKKLSSRCLPIVGAVLIIFVLGTLFGLMVNRWYWRNYKKSQKGEVVRLSDQRYSYINPLLECAVAEDYIGSNEGKPSKAKLIRLIERLREEGMIDFASVYFRNLNDGPWVGINEKEDFSPASLLKLPIMMSLLRSGEVDPQYLSRIQSVDYASRAVVGRYFKDDFLLAENQAYSLRDLMEAIIVHSDNDAAYTLLNHVLTNEQFNKIFSDLRIESLDQSGNDRITVKDYAVFFRVLFNASYLSRSSSEYALELLSQSTFKEGLVAGLPPGIKVAHKFGERTDGDSKQLHDCGIVYLPKTPYLLCVMTRGKDYVRLASSIAQISKATYDDMIMSLK